MNYIKSFLAVKQVQRFASLAALKQAASKPVCLFHPVANTAVLLAPIEAQELEEALPLFQAVTEL